MPQKAPGIFLAHNRRDRYGTTGNHQEGVQMKLFLFISVLLLYGLQVVAEEQGFTHITPIMSSGFIRSELIQPLYENSIEDFNRDKLQIDLSYPTTLTIGVRADAFVVSIVWIYTATYEGLLLPCPDDKEDTLAGICEVHQRSELLLPRETPQPAIKTPRELKT